MLRDVPAGDIASTLRIGLSVAPRRYGFVIMRQRAFSA
jgi:hypothetical protein